MRHKTIPCLVDYIVKNWQFSPKISLNNMQYFKQSFWLNVVTYQVANSNIITCQWMNIENLPPYWAHCPPITLFSSQKQRCNGWVLGSMCMGLSLGFASAIKRVLYLLLASCHMTEWHWSDLNLSPSQPNPTNKTMASQYLYGKVEWNLFPNHGNTDAQSRVTTSTLFAVLLESTYIRESR